MAFSSTFLALALVTLGQAQYVVMSQYDLGEDTCSGTAKKKTVMTWAQWMAALKTNTPGLEDGVCIAGTAGTSSKITGSTCTYSHYSSTDCTGTPHAESMGVCQTSPEDDCDATVEGNNCISVKKITTCADSVPTDATEDMTCMTEAMISAGQSDNGCAGTCGEADATDCETLKTATQTGCASSCPEEYKKLSVATYIGCACLASLGPKTSVAAAAASNTGSPVLVCMGIVATIATIASM